MAQAVESTRLGYASHMPRLSKSRLMSSLQCARRVHFEVHRPELAVYSPATQMAFELGHQVGDIAIEVYGQGRGELIPYEAGLGQALQLTAGLLRGPRDEPVFEATLQHDGVLVREDVLLPSGASWRIVEVKASTKPKPEHVQDCAIQAWVHEGAGYPLESIALAHIDNRFVYPGGGDYRGILVEQDLTAEVRELQTSVPVWVQRAKEAVAGDEPQVPVGQHCFSPYECPFFTHCWPQDSAFPVHGLRGSRKKLGELVSAGYRDIREIPAALLNSEDHLRIRRVTRSGQPEILPGAGEFVRALPYPRYYLDFETIAPAVPVWPGTRPYELLPFQWSCHIEPAPGQVSHAEFLDLSGEPPMRALAEELVRTLGRSGPVIMYTAYEQRVIEGLAERCPDLANALQAIIERLVDLRPVTKANYYHPAMLGSWSIKAVAPTIASGLDYAQLDGIAEGNQASSAFLEAIRPGAPAERVAAVRRELLEYCRRDTEVMLRLAAFFAAH